MPQESNKANTSIMPNIANIARKRSAVRAMFNMADTPFMPNKSNTPNEANTVIMPDIANMTRAPSVLIVGTSPDMADAPFRPNKSNTPITPGIANTVIMPDVANMARVPSVTDKPNKPSYFTFRRKSRYDKHVYRRSHMSKKPHYKQVFDRAHGKFDKDHERAEQSQARHIRALAWWQAWHHLQAARHEMAVRTLWQINDPCPSNLVYLQAA
jgi:hypothetical protein